MSLIDETEWTSLDVDVKAAAYEGLLEKAAAEGKKVASYIRRLAVPVLGRPWNPPYQPGPGLDSKPVSHWAAGAGLGAG